MKKVSILILVVIIFGIGYLYWLNDQSWRSTIPIELGLGSTQYSNSDQQGLRESCGVHVFELKQITIDQIEKEGISFLNTAKQARGDSNYYYSYGEWLHTPRKDWKRPENWSYELMCSNLATELQGIIINSGKSEGSFYSHGQEKTLMVIPKHKLIVLTHNG